MVSKEIVVTLSWFVATLIGYLYIHFGTKDLDIIQDKLKVEVYRAAFALMIMRGTLYTAKDVFQLWQ